MDRNEKTDIMMALLRSQICGTELPEGICDALSHEDKESLISLCEMFDVSEALFRALIRSGAAAKGDGIYEALVEVQERSFFRYKRLEHTLAEVGRALTEARICYTPLKGAVMREHYPSPMLRMSADIDVLVRECDLDAACRALVAAGFRTKGGRSFHDVSLYSPDGMHLELHYNIKENDERLDPTLERAFDYLMPPEEGEYECRFTPEFFAFHLVTHMSYHFINGGCGIRPFADLWIWRHRVGCDENTVRTLCRECGIEDFYTNVSLLSEVWFSAQPHTSLTRKMEGHLIYNALCEGVEKGVAVRQSRDGKLGYILSRIFMPYSQLKIRYPIVGKFPPLLPVFEVVRWVSFLFGDKSGASQELKGTKTLTNEMIIEILEFLNEVGLY